MKIKNFTIEATNDKGDIKLKFESFVETPDGPLDPTLNALRDLLKDIENLTCNHPIASIVAFDQNPAKYTCSKCGKTWEYNPSET